MNVHLFAVVCAAILASLHPGCDAQLGDLFSSFRSIIARFGSSASNTARRGGNSFRSNAPPISKTVRDLDFMDCSGPNALARPTAIDVQQPFTVPGTVLVSGSGVLSRPIQGSVQGRIRLCRKVLGGFCLDIPCIDNLGSCDYEDLCGNAARLTRELGGCPLGGGRCACPVPAGPINVQNYRHVVRRRDVSLATANSLASAIVNGDYEMTISGTANGQEIGCIRMTFTIE